MTCDAEVRRAAPWPARRRRPAPRSRGRSRARARCGRRRSRTSACRRGRRGRAGAGAAASRCAPGAGDISSCHFGHSVLWMTIETGRAERAAVADAAEELDARRARSASAGPRPKPRRRRASSAAMSSMVTGRPAGRPSTIDDQRRAVRLPRGQVAQHDRPGTRRWRPGGGPSTGTGAPGLRTSGPDVALPGTSRGSRSPTSTAVSAPAARNGPNGTWSLRVRSPVTIRHDADDRAVEEPEEQPEHHLAPPEPAEGEAEDERQLHVAEAHARGETRCSTKKTTNDADRRRPGPGRSASPSPSAARPPGRAARPTRP